MPYTLRWLPSFKRCIKGLDPQKKKVVKIALHALTVYFSTNNDLLKAKEIAPGFFFKNLRKPFYEIGTEGQWRIVLRKDDLAFTAILAGNHDQVRRFLSQN